jgi:5'-3' exoribonuclease 2
MTDPDSEIIDFYPENFKIDLNGKKYAWQGVALLPFIEEQRLLEAMEKNYVKLDDEDLALNRRGNDLLFVAQTSKLYEFLCDLFGTKKPSDVCRFILQ